MKRVRPTRNSAWFSIGRSSEIRSSPRKVPFVLPRSRSRKVDPWHSTAAWRREASGSGISMSALARPSARPRSPIEAVK